MSKFGEVVTTKKGDSNVKFGSDFVKLTSDHQTILRILDEQPEVFWSHYIPKGHRAFPSTNAGKGMSFACPGMDTCPICAWNKKQKEDNPGTKDTISSRRLYTFNVLDRTPVVICSNCEAEHYKIDSNFPEVCDCGNDLSEAEEKPANKIKILQKGKRIYEQLVELESEPSYGDLLTYDIKFNTRGTGKDSMTVCMPMQKSNIKLNEAVGEDWKEQLYDVPKFIAPLSVEKINRILSGEDYYKVAKES